MLGVDYNSDTLKCLFQNQRQKNRDFRDRYGQTFIPGRPVSAELYDRISMWTASTTESRWTIATPRTAIETGKFLSLHIDKHFSF